MTSSITLEYFADFPVGAVPLEQSEFFAEQVKKNLGSILQDALKLEKAVPTREIPTIIINKTNLPEFIKAIWKKLNEIAGAETNKETTKMWIKATVCDVSGCRAFVRDHSIPRVTISVKSIEDMQAKVNATLGSETIYAPWEKKAGMNALYDSLPMRIKELEKAVPVITLMRRFRSFETQNIDDIIAHFGIDRINALEIAGFWKKFPDFLTLKEYMDQDKHPKRATLAPTVIYSVRDVHQAVLDALHKFCSPFLIMLMQVPKTPEDNPYILNCISFHLDDLEALKSTAALERAQTRYELFTKKIVYDNDNPEEFFQYIHRICRYTNDTTLSQITEDRAKEFHRTLENNFRNHPSYHLVPTTAFQSYLDLETFLTDLNIWRFDEKHQSAVPATLVTNEERSNKRQMEEEDLQDSKRVKLGDEQSRSDEEHAEQEQYEDGYSDSDSFCEQGTTGVERGLPSDCAANEVFEMIRQKGLSNFELLRAAKNIIVKVLGTNPEWCSVCAVLGHSKTMKKNTHAPEHCPLKSQLPASRFANMFKSG